MPKDKATGVDEAVLAYLSDKPTEGQEGYARVRALVQAQAGPERVSERLSYQMPTFFVGATPTSAKRLLHVGLWEEHLAIYPVPESDADPALSDDLAPFRKGKGTLHFPYRNAWPGELIERIVAAHLARIG